MLHIGNVKINGKLALAPMAGVNCTAFRLMCREQGAALVYTQMYHADFLWHKAKNEGKEAVFKHINIIDKERPVAIQLVAYKPETLVEAAKIIEPIADIIDINLGCCDPDIIRSGAGAHFAKHPEKIEWLIKPVIEAVKKPVSAKIRIGYDSQNINGVAVAQMLESLGVKALAVHGRVATQKYAGKANWEIIKHIKSKLRIPVIGNGDIKDKQSYKEFFERTGCDMAMIGRRAMGDPSVFARLEGRPVEDTLELFRKFENYYNKYDSSFTELRTHALWFSKRARIGGERRDKIVRARSQEEINSIFFSR